MFTCYHLFLFGYLFSLALLKAKLPDAPSPPAGSASEGARISFYGKGFPSVVRDFLL